jgi:hypothetical protein
MVIQVVNDSAERANRMKPNEIKTKPSRLCLGLLKRRECLVPTRRGWLAMLIVGAGLTVLVARGIQPFLAVNDPAPGGVLVVEGWVPDHCLKQVMAEFGRSQYSKLYVTGGPIDQGAPLSEYKTYAELGAAILVRFGMNTNSVQAVPTPRVRQDRTYASAVALKNWLRAHALAPTSFHVFTMGAHARRTRLMFEKALGPETRIGITAVPPSDEDPIRWWRTSAGVRTVIDETVAYTYARLLFRPPKQ